MHINLSNPKKLISKVFNFDGEHTKSAHMITKEQEVFLLTVFTEANEHLRATDEKSILVGGYFVALTSIIGGILLDKFWTPNLLICAFSFAFLIIGYFIIVLQLWYRKWKEHYINVCKYIADYYLLEETLLPCWLNKQQKELNIRFSTDKLVFIISLAVELVILMYFVYMTLNLLLLKKVPIPLDVMVMSIIGLACIFSIIMGRFLLSTMEA